MSMRLPLSGFLLIIASLSMADHAGKLPLAITGIMIAALLALTVILDSSGLRRS